MTEAELRTALDDGDWAAATETAEFVAREGDVDWVIIPLDDGRWAATDDAVVDGDHVDVFPTRLAALAAQWEGWLTRYPGYDPARDDTPQFGWIAAPEWLTPDQAAARYGLADGGVVRTARHRGRIHEGGIWQIHGKAWMIRAEEAERLWGAGKPKEE
jgi:hypothetical protein